MGRTLIFVIATFLTSAQAHAEDKINEFSGRIVATVGFGTSEHASHHDDVNVAVGLAGGVDYFLNEEAFVGVEAAISHNFDTTHHHVFDDHEGQISGSLMARGGAVIAPQTKAYALAGISISSEDRPFVYGAGIERAFGRMLASLEYRHANNYGSDQVRLGIGFEF